MESILTSIKKLLGITEDYDHFDEDIIMHINTVFMTLTQLGIGPADGFTISGDELLWTDFVPISEVAAVKSYTYLRVRLLFDPPLNSSVLASMERTIAELEWRLNVAVDPAT